MSRRSLSRRSGSAERWRGSDRRTVRRRPRVTVADVRKPTALAAVLVGVAALVGAGLAAAPASGATAATRVAVHAHAATRTPIQVGSLLLRPCSVLSGAYCGHLDRPWDSTNALSGTIRIGFAFVPAGDPSLPLLGTVVPHEGGPGYSTTGSASSYYDMYGPLLRQRNFLVVDQRGTGRSEPIDCPALQDLVTQYAPAAAKCGKQLGDHSDLYGSADSADDLAAVVRALGLGTVDLYGDSYGTFFTQVFVGRHPDLVRSVVLDSAYPTYGEDAWYPTQGPAMLSSIDTVCARTPSCAAYGVPTSTLLARVLAQVRRTPYTGVGHDADGIRHRVVVDGKALVGAGVRGHLRAGVLPRASRCAPLGPARRPPAAGPAGRRGRLRLRRRRRPGRLQRRAGRRGQLPRLPAAVRHERSSRAAPGAVPGGGAGRAAVRPERLRPVHRGGVPRLGLGGAGLVPELAGAVGRAPGWAARAAGRALRERPGARAVRRARLDHHAGRRGARHHPVPRRRCRCTWRTAST